MERGDATIEFYANLPWLKEQYEAGQVVAKFLYKKAVKEKGFKMCYVQFNKYFNEELNYQEYQKKQIEKIKKQQELEKKSIKIDWSKANYFTNNIKGV